MMENDDQKTQIRVLEALQQQILWTAMWMIHHANHLRPHQANDVKVGGHQASSASLASIMAVLYYHSLKPADRVAVKPHASPIFHAIHYLMGSQSLEKIMNFRGFGGAQSYPSRTKDCDDVDFSTGSVGLGVAITSFAALIQDYVIDKGWLPSDRKGRMVALIGDAELDEGNIYEALNEIHKHDVRNLWWIIDYNRQSLDSLVEDQLNHRLQAIFESYGWRVVMLKYGQKQQKFFAQPGGEVLQHWLDKASVSLYSALTFKGGKSWRVQLTKDLGHDQDFMILLGKLTDEELHDLMTNLGGHCIPSLMAQFDAAIDDQPTLFFAYTIKGWNTPLAGHKDNHAGLMNHDQMALLKNKFAVKDGDEWSPLATIKDREKIQNYLSKVPFFAQGARRYQAEPVPTIPPIFIKDAVISTQAAFGKILDEIAKRDCPLADRIMTTAPDVSVSTNLGSWINRRKLYRREDINDPYHGEQIPSMQKWVHTKQGQHIELGIAEMNLFLLLAAAGLSHSLFQQRLIPIGTVYDPFICRGLDALIYACYQDARFIIVGTPSGITLAGEGGAHQSISTPLIGIAQDGIASFEPAFADELSIIMAWAFDYVQRSRDDSKNEPQDERTWLRDESGGSVYLRLSTRPLEQIDNSHQQDPDFARNVVEGGYWLRPASGNCDIAIIYQGCIAPEAIMAAGIIGSEICRVSVLAVTSADRLNAGWHAATSQRRRGNHNAKSLIERLLEPLPLSCRLITVTDGHPLTLSWIGSVKGHRTYPLGVEHFGQTGTIDDLYRCHAIDVKAIVNEANAALAKPIVANFVSHSLTK